MKTRVAQLGWLAAFEQDGPTRELSTLMHWWRLEAREQFLAAWTMIRSVELCFLAFSKGGDTKIGGCLLYVIFIASCIV